MVARIPRELALSRRQDGREAFLSLRKTRMGNIAIGRVIGLVLAVLGIGLSICFGYTAVRMDADFHEWLVARPMETAIDLSEPGETTAPFHQTCGISHGEALYLECDLDDEARRNPEELLKGLAGVVVLRGTDGNEIQTLEFSDETIRYWNDSILLAEFAPFRTGEYVATIRIDSGAPALAGKQQTIHAKYQLCGLERMPAQFSGAFAMGAGLIGLVAAVCVLPGLLRYGIWREVPKNDS